MHTYLQNYLSFSWNSHSVGLPLFYVATPVVRLLVKPVSIYRQSLLFTSVHLWKSHQKCKIKIILIILSINFHLSRNHHLYYQTPLCIGQLKCKLRLFFLMNILQRWIKLMNNWLMGENDMWVLMALLGKSISGVGGRKRSKWLCNCKLLSGLHSSALSP